MANTGKQSIKFNNKISIKATSSIVGPKEGEGPLAGFFDRTLSDILSGQDTWEKAESIILKDAISLAVEKSGLLMENIDYIMSGDILNQNISSTFGIKDTGRPFLGLFSACSAIGEGMSLGAMILDGGFAENVIACASSHFCAAEKQFRSPLELGTQRPLTSTWTVTGAGCALLTKNGSFPFITGATTGKIVDLGQKDANNMGAAMAPAAADTILNHFLDFKRDPSYYDLIITGDLGYVGKDLVLKILHNEGYDISNNYSDCGIEIFDSKTQDTHSGGSGCACSATTFAGLLFQRLKKRELNKILFVPTGALLSTTSTQQGQSIPGIAHAIAIEN